MQNEQINDQLVQVADVYESLRGSNYSDSPTRYGKTGKIDKRGEGTKLTDIRFLPPGLRLPKSFWHPKWCFYHVAVGDHPKFSQEHDKGTFDWQIGFLHAPGNSNCGSGLYAKGVIDILRGAESKRPKDFFVVEPGDPRPSGDSTAGDWKFINIFRRYYHREFPEFTPETIAQDLLWLMLETYPKFKALGT